MIELTFNRKAALSGALLACVAFPESVAWGCPYCDSDIGEEVAAGIFNGDFWLNGALTLLPVPALFLIVALIHFGPPWPFRSRHRADDEEVSAVSNTPQPASEKRWQTTLTHNH